MFQQVSIYARIAQHQYFDHDDENEEKYTKRNDETEVIRKQARFFFMSANKS